MKITNKILCQRTKEPLSKALHLDLSSLGIGSVEGLEQCINIQSLDLSNNCLEEFENFESCKHLWSINLCNNKISCLDGFPKIFALGMLDLSNNFIPWKELAQLQSVHILDLRLHGNPELENDTYYRMHVIDCLPNVWMLDGRLVTSAERLQVQQFFQESALCNRPVRRKLNERPLEIARISKSKSVHGCRASKFAASFSHNEPHNSENDKRRLLFLARNFQQDIQIRSSTTKGSKCQHIRDDCLVKLVEYRYKDKERCNMLLLMLISSIEFNLPLDLIKQTLAVANLNPMFGVDTMQVFTFDLRLRTDAISVLMSACKLDREVKKRSDSNFTSGGLYDRLYLCLYHAVARLIKAAATCGKKPKNWLDYVNTRRELTSRKPRPHTAPPRISNHSSLRGEWKPHQRLLASELVLLLSVVPVFYHYVAHRDSNVCELLYIATGDSRLAARLAALSDELSANGGNINALYGEISRSVRRRIEFAAHSADDDEIVAGVMRDEPSEPIYLDVGRLSSNTKQSRLILNAADAYPKRPKSGILTSSEQLTAGRRRQINAADEARTSKSFTTRQVSLALGSQVLLGPQNLARVIALPEPQIALVQMDSVPAPNGSVVAHARDAEEHFCYIDIDMLEYEYRTGFWKPQGAVGDRVTLQTTTASSESSSEMFLDAEQSYAEVGTKESSLIKRIPEGEQYHAVNIQSRSPKDIARSSGPPLKNDTPRSKSAAGTEWKGNKTSSLLKPLSSLFCEKIELTLSEAVVRSGIFPALSSRDADDGSAQGEQHEGDRAFITQHPASLNNEFTDSDYDATNKYIRKPAQPMRNNVSARSGVTFHRDIKLANAVVPPSDYENNGETPGDLASELNSRGDDADGEDSEIDPEEEQRNYDEALSRSDQSSNANAGYMKTGGREFSLSFEDRPASRPKEAVDVSLSGTAPPGGESVNADAGEEKGNSALRSEMEEKMTSRSAQRIETTNEKSEAKSVQSITIESKSRPPPPKARSSDLPGHAERQRKATEASTRRVQSARISRKSSALKGALRPYSAAPTRVKHVAFEDGDTDSRPGSASSFQLRRTEAWRSSASSGSVGLGMVSDQGVPRVKGFVVDTRGENNPLRGNTSLATVVRRPPPQRPTSPDHLSVDAFAVDDVLLGDDVSKGVGGSGAVSSRSRSTSPARVSRLASAATAPRSAGGMPVVATSWLAEGRNLHHEHEVSRKLITSPRLPGYLVGTGMMPPKAKKPDNSSYSTLRSDVAVHLLPSRPAKPFARLPHTSYGRALDRRISVARSSLGGALVWSRPRFSALRDLKQLSSKPSSRQAGRPCRNKPEPDYE